VPLTTSPENLREKIAYYLKNENERQEIIEICHNYIDKNHRYENVFEVIGGYYKLSLLNQQEGKLYLPYRTLRKQKIYLKKQANV
jgi:hypothetical protein